MTVVRRHTCHAERCNTACKPEYLMCGKHWRMVDKNLQQDVWSTYVPGQCDFSPLPSLAWLAAAQAAIECVARKEGLG